MKSKNWFIGIIILFIGVVALLNTSGVIDFSWRIAWRMWPILLIFIGIAILPVKDWLKAVLLVATLAVGMLLYRNEAKKEAERYPSGWYGTVRQWWDELDDDVFDIF